MDRQPGFTPPIVPPDARHREHLHSLWTGLAHTRGIIERGAAAFAESMKLLDRLNGQATGKP